MLPVPAPGSGTTTAKGAASLLGVHVSTVYKLVKIGQLKAARVGGRLRFRREEVLRLIDARHEPPRA